MNNGTIKPRVFGDAHVGTVDGKVSVVRAEWTIQPLRQFMQGAIGKKL